MTDYGGASSIEIESGYGDYNLGGLEYIRANQSRTWEQSKILLHFDLSALKEQGLQVTGASVVLYSWSAASTEEVPFSLYQILPANAGWVQGRGNFSSPALAGETTWNDKATPGTDWAGSAGLGTAEVDYNSSTLATGTYSPADSAGTAYTLNLPTSLVQEWIDNAEANAGLLILTAQNPTQYYEFASFYSVASGVQEFRPMLVLEVTAIPEPSTAALGGLAAIASLSLAIFSKRSGGRKSR